MPKYRVPDAQEQEILRRNQMDPQEYAVSYRTDREIYLLCYKTRDQIVIREGDKHWAEK